MLTRLILFVLALCGASAVRAQTPPLSDARIRQIAAMLPPEPAGFGAPCANRSAWGPIAGSDGDSVSRAEGYLQRPIPAWSDDAYLEFSRKGTRPSGEAMLRGRDGQLSTLVLAECSQWQGRFLSRIAEQLDVISSQRSWTEPAHDGRLENFNGTRYYIELNSAGLGHTVAEALYLLGDKIPAATRDRAMAALDLHMFAPMRRLIANKDDRYEESWFAGNSNWNAVCWNGVAGAALTVIKDRSQRALFTAAAEIYSNGYLKSYTDDGYAEEGIGYWSYGFSNYEQLREQLWLSTKGKIDLFNNAKARKAALFPFQFQMLPGVYADFGDARFDTRPDAVLMARVDRIFGLGIFKDTDAERSKALSGALPEAVLIEFPNASIRHGDGGASGAVELIGPRTYYADAGVLVDRPAAGGGLGVTIKASGNARHSHNDIGSFSIGLASTQPVGDPGGPLAYNASTFTTTRYTSKLLNSFGHPVPEINGQLQMDATKVTVPAVITSFSPDRDIFTLDETKAYDVPQLRKLIRTMTYSRKGVGAVDIVDQFELAGPADIVESLPTHGACRQIDAKTLEFTYQDAHLRVSFDAPVTFTLLTEEVNEYGDPFTRVAAKLHLESSGRIAMHFEEAR